MAPSSPTVVNADNTSGSKTVVQFNPVAQLPIKLTGSHNFSLWKAQVSMLMCGHNLFGHLDGSKPTPSQTISANNQEVPNPDFLAWFQQDQLIQNAVLASVDSTIASTVASAANAKMAWDALHIAYANKSQTHTFSLRDCLDRLSKDSLPIADYLHQVRTLCDELATAGSLVFNEELVVKILTGLGSEFRHLSAAIRARDSTISYEKLYEKLLDHEFFLHHEEAKRTPSAPITVDIAQGTASTPTRQGSNNNRRSNAPNNNNLNQQSRNQAWRNNQQPRRNNQQQQPPNNSIYCQLCDGRVHTAHVCRTRSHNHFQAPANYAASFQNQQAPWIVDSGATHHIASDTQSLATMQDYHGSEDIVMGNGNTIPISYTGSDYGGTIGSRMDYEWAV
ncbi:PREDICTED: uncharacterized protein LOC109229883 [Nicotiana attenuata]|uniref:uncharacterized protein LOC109229883 n=1 Tax=Nicotiana attenuata TaxID=49451 RepID=UPI00090513C6|nr:PREDICTED: uncharacterized protein LOC109229883 [Nicotiana attenuata]